MKDMIKRISVILVSMVIGILLASWSVEIWNRVWEGIDLVNELLGQRGTLNFMIDVFALPIIGLAICGVLVSIGEAVGLIELNWRPAHFIVFLMPAVMMTGLIAAIEPLFIWLYAVVLCVITYLVIPIFVDKIEGVLEERKNVNKR